MSDPRGIIGVPEVSSAVQPSARIERLSRRKRRNGEEPQEKKQGKRPRRLPNHLEEDGEQHLDLLA